VCTREGIVLVGKGFQIQTSLSQKADEYYFCHILPKLSELIKLIGVKDKEKEK
jgi:hypothetical protein